MVREIQEIIDLKAAFFTPIFYREPLFRPILVKESAEIVFPALN